MPPSIYTRQYSAKSNDEMSFFFLVHIVFGNSQEGTRFEFVAVDIFNQTANVILLPKNGIIAFVIQEQGAQLAGSMKICAGYKYI